MDKEKGAPAFPARMPLHLRILLGVLPSLLFQLLGSNEIENDQRDATGHEHARKIDRAVQIVHSIQPRGDKQTDTYKCGEKTPFETRKWIGTEPLSHWNSLEIGWIDSLFDHGHSFFVSVVVVDNQHSGSAAEKEDWNQEFAVHNTSCVRVLKLTFVWAFGIFDLAHEQKVTFEINALCNPRFGFVV
jgi:hypothetical protein